MRLLKLLLVMLVCAAGPAVAGPFEDAYTRTMNGVSMSLMDAFAAYNKGDYATALGLLRPLADQGNAKAQTNLGFMYATGQGVTRDDAQALFWYRKAADQGNAGAQFSLGLIYANGQGVTRDYAAAVLWYRKAAEQGDADAQTNLGLMYAVGQGVPKDYVQAHMWLNLAASNSETKAAAEYRDTVAKKMTPAQIAEAQKLAREWKPK